MVENIKISRNWMTSNYFTFPFTIALIAVFSYYSLGDTPQMTILKVFIVPLAFMSDAFINFRYVSEASKTKWTKLFLEKQLFRAVSLSGFGGTFLWSASDSLLVVLFRYVGLLVLGFLVSTIFTSNWRSWPPSTR
jgi:hypothetical protein